MFSLCVEKMTENQLNLPHKQLTKYPVLNALRIQETSPVAGSPVSVSASAAHAQSCCHVTRLLSADFVEWPWCRAETENCGVVVERLSVVEPRRISCSIDLRPHISTTSSSYNTVKRPLQIRKHPNDLLALFFSRSFAPTMLVPWLSYQSARFLAYVTYHNGIIYAEWAQIQKKETRSQTGRQETRSRRIEVQSKNTNN